MSFLLVLPVLSMADSIPATTLIDFEAGNNGDLLTKQMISNCTAGVTYLTWMGVDDGSARYREATARYININSGSQHNLYTPALVNGVLDAGTGTRGVNVIGTGPSYLVLNFPAKMANMSAGFYFRWNGPGIDWQQRDLAAFVDDGNGHYNFFSGDDQGPGGSPVVYVHYLGGAGKGTHISISRNHWYWITLRNGLSGSRSAAVYVYDAQNNYVLVGTSTSDFLSSYAGTTQFIMGHVKYTASRNPSTESWDYDGLVINTNAAFPLGPGTGGGSVVQRPPAPSGLRIVGL